MELILSISVLLNVILFGFGFGMYHKSKQMELSRDMYKSKFELLSHFNLTKKRKSVLN